MWVRSLGTMALFIMTLGACKGTDKTLGTANDSGVDEVLPEDSGDAADPELENETGSPPDDSDVDGTDDDTVSPSTDNDGDGFTPEGGDCDDWNPDVHPDATEVCDGDDNNCDGTIDEDANDMIVWYADYDGDGFGHDEVIVEACSAPDDMVGMPGDCDDMNALVHPSAPEVCDDVDNDCDGAVDGATALDAIVQWEDSDGDGFGFFEDEVAACFLLPEHVENDLDCDDRDEDVFPGALETCNKIDDDCDDTIDEGFRFERYFADADGDHHGDPLIAVDACSPPEGFVTDSSDCDDRESTVHAGMPELCDERDNDCDGDIDEELVSLVWYVDSDGDGYGDAGLPTMESCARVSGRSLEVGDCDDSDADIYPGAWERCNGEDDDCDGRPDDGLDEIMYFMDSDGDGYGDADYTEVACDLPDGFSEIDGDCNDSDASVNPGIYADCEDGRDEDCDGDIDEGPDSTWYLDSDGDGFGDADETIVSCLMPDGYSASDDDCDDVHEDVHPGARERCDDGLDGDCDGWSDDLDPDCDCPDHGIVEDEDLGESTGDRVASGNNASSDASVDGMCGSTGGRDEVFLWTAPEDGCYTFDTESSSYDTVLRLLDACEGTELACDDDGGRTSLTSSIQEPLEEGTTLFVVVDGYSSSSTGDYVLDINYEVATSESDVHPYDEDLGDEVGDALASGSNAGMIDDFSGSCGSSGGEDVAFLWEAPDTGCYIIDTEASSYDTVLRLYDAGGEVGISCGADSSGELACDDDGGSTSLTSMIRYTFSEGDEYVIVVDAYSSSSGTYELDINPC
jgi:hypothetical protein